MFHISVVDLEKANMWSPFRPSLAECSVINDTLTTFNNKKSKNEVPHSCYQVLAEDCTPELKFIVMLRKDQIQDQDQINIKISDM